MTRVRRESAWFEKADAPMEHSPWLANDVGHDAGGANESDDSIDRQPSPERIALHEAQRDLEEANAAAERLRVEADDARKAILGLRGELDDATASLQRMVTTLREEAEQELVKLALAVAERVIARELTCSPDLIVSWAREAIVGSVLGEHFEVALSSACVGADWAELAPHVMLDPALAEGGCEVRDGGTVIPVDAGTRLRLVAEHLLAVSHREAA